MKFLCLIAVDGSRALPQAEAADELAAYADFTQSLVDAGHYVDAARLAPPTSAVTVRVRGGAVSTTEGPFAETNGQIGGFYLVDARDLNEAIRLAARVPGARRGAVEVRPLAEAVR